MLQIRSYWDENFQITLKRRLRKWTVEKIPKSQASTWSGTERGLNVYNIYFNYTFIKSFSLQLFALPFNFMNLLIWHHFLIHTSFRQSKLILNPIAKTNLIPLLQPKSPCWGVWRWSRWWAWRWRFLSWAASVWSPWSPQCPSTVLLSPICWGRKSCNGGRVECLGLIWYFLDFLYKLK